MQTYTNKQVSGFCLPINTTAVNRENYTCSFTNQTNRWLRRVSGAIALSLTMSLLAATQAVAGSFFITKIADTRSDFTTIPNTAPAMNDSGTVAFFAQGGVYTGNNGGITEIVNSNDVPSLYGTIPVNTSQFSYNFNSIPYIKNDGTVVFDITRLNIQTSVDNIFVGQSGSITPRANLSYDTRSSGSSITGTFNEQDELAYIVGSLPRLSPSAPPDTRATSNIFLSKPNQPDVKIASAAYNLLKSFALPPDAPFSKIGSFAINNKGELIFAATRQSDNTSAIFTSNGNEPTSILETSSLVAVSTQDSAGNITLNPRQGALSINDNGDILFVDAGAMRLLNRNNGNLNTILDPNNSSFQALSNPALNNSNQVAYTATLPQGEKGIFIGADPVGDKVIATGDTLEGSTVIDLNFLRPGLNNNGQIAFYVRLADGTEGIFRADPSEVETPPPTVPPVEDTFALSRIVDTNTSIPDGSGSFTGFDKIATRDDVVFYGTSGVRESSNQGIYKISGGILSTIADKNTPAPGGSGTFTYFTNLNVVGTDGVNVVFTGDFNLKPGIYIKRGDAPIEVVADKNTPIPNGTGNFSDLSLLTLFNVISYENSVAFSGYGTSGQQGIYISRDGNLLKVADNNTPIPNGTSNFSIFYNIALYKNNVAFRAFGASGQGGIYISRDGNLLKVADNNTPIPNGTGNFSSFNQDQYTNVALYENNVAFYASGTSGQKGIYISLDGTLQVVADTNRPIPGGTGNFIGFDSNPLLKENNVVFIATDASGQQGGIYISRNGTLQVIVDKNTTVPGSTNKFTSFDNYTVCGEAVAFVGSVGNTPLGIYVNIGGSLFKVADLSTRLDGKRISDFSRSSISLEGSSLAFTATFTDGTQAILKADLSAYQSPK